LLLSFIIRAFIADRYLRINRHSRNCFSYLSYRFSSNSLPFASCVFIWSLTTRLQIQVVKERQDRTINYIVYQRMEPNCIMTAIAFLRTITRDLSISSIRFSRYQLSRGHCRKSGFIKLTHHRRTSFPSLFEVRCARKGERGLRPSASRNPPLPAARATHCTHSFVSRQLSRSINLNYSLHNRAGRPHRSYLCH